VTTANAQCRLVGRLMVALARDRAYHLFTPRGERPGFQLLCDLGRPCMLRFTLHRPKSAHAEGLFMARCDDPIGAAARLLPDRMGAPGTEPQRVLRPPRGRTQNQRSSSSNERACDGRDPLGQRQSCAPGSSHADCAVQDSSFSGWGPLRPFGHGEGNPLPASPDLQANCCSTSSSGRTRHMSKWADLLRRSKRCDAPGSACNRSPGSHPGDARGWPRRRGWCRTARVRSGCAGSLRPSVGSWSSGSLA
jgi:hypothetical protein